LSNEDNGYYDVIIFIEDYAEKVSMYRELRNNYNKKDREKYI